MAQAGETNRAETSTDSPLLVTGVFRDRHALRVRVLSLAVLETFGQAAGTGRRHRPI